MVFNGILVTCSIFTACSSAVDFLSVRKVGLFDVDTLADVGLAAMPMDLQSTTAYAIGSSSVLKTRKFTREQYKKFLESEPGDWQVMVTELLSRKSSSISEAQVAVFAFSCCSPKSESN